MEEVSERLRELHTAYREDYRAYYERHADEFSPPMRGADPAAVLVPGVGMFSFGADKQTARVAGEFYVNAINVMRGAESVSTYAPISEHEKFRIEYWSLEEAKLRRRPTPRPLATRVALVPSCAEFRPSRHAVRPPPTGREAADGSRDAGGLPAAAVAAVDLGASSGRVMVGCARADRLEVHEVHRFQNVPVVTAPHGRPPSAGSPRRGLFDTFQSRP